MEKEIENEVRVPTMTRWPGVVLSLFVPGFGFVRAGETQRGVIWFCSLVLLSFMTGWLMVTEFIPVWVGFASVLVGIAAYVWMLKMSYMGGRMSGRLWLIFVLIALLLTFCPSPARIFGQQYRVPTGAMEPTLQGASESRFADQVMADQYSYYFSEPERGDLAVLLADEVPELSRMSMRSGMPSGQRYVKRIVGLPGEQVEIREGSVFADGKELTEADGIPEVVYQNIGSYQSLKLGDSDYFVLGDNSPNSSDSRIWGPVPRSSIIGKVTKIIFPFSRIGPPNYTQPSTESKQVLRTAP